MTPPTQDDLAAGRELDAEVAEKVMGWQDVHPEDNYDPRAHQRTTILVGLLTQATNTAILGIVPAYSTDIGAAWQIVEHLTAQASMFHLWRSPLTKEWRIDVDAADGSDRVVGVWADTAPLAICKAALKAVSG